MNNFFKAFRFVITTHLAALLVLSVLRLAQYFYLNDFVDATVSNPVWPAFVRGLWLDNVAVCYVMILPYVLLLFISSIIPFFNKYVWRTVVTVVIAVLSVEIALQAANLQYFKYFSNVINSSIFEWTEEAGTAVTMILEEPSYWVLIISGLSLIALFSIFIWSQSEKTLEGLLSEKTVVNYVDRLKIFAASLVVIGLCMFGIRGRMGYNPIKVSAAYYCDDYFLNRLGVNAAFNLLNTYIDNNRRENRGLNLMDGETAVREIRRDMQNGSQDIFVADSLSLQRHIKRDSSAVFAEGEKPNVVIILMESMSAKLMRHFGCDVTMTPFLDSLWNESLSFDNFYSVGNHTNQGIYSTLYGFPTVLSRNAMKGTDIPTYYGMPNVFAEKDYSTSFYMTHESQYDNMNAFLRTNGFKHIRSQEDYPRDSIVNSFGVSDGFLFDYALNELKTMQQPFFSVLLTISNHPPYVVPDWFDAHGWDAEYAIVLYADYCLKKFFEGMKRCGLYENTVFVFVADHGKIVGRPECEVAESFNHVPLIIHSPRLGKKIVKTPACQTDIQPILLSLLGIEYDNVGFGRNVLNNPTSSVVYSTDGILCARDSSYLCLIDPRSEFRKIYDIRENYKELVSVDIAGDPCLTLDTLLRRRFAAYEYLVSQKKTTLVK
jgi:phosphoglycerol transferase MdoB-like AlkP superfamily enzyme